MDDDLRTLWCGNISEDVTEEILYELFLQAGPLDRVTIPKDKDGKQRSYAFIVYKHQCSVQYAIALYEGTYLCNRLLNMKTRNNISVPSRSYINPYPHLVGIEPATNEIPVDQVTYPVPPMINMLNNTPYMQQLMGYQFTNLTGSNLTHLKPYDNDSQQSRKPQNHFKSHKDHRYNDHSKHDSKPYSRNKNIFDRLGQKPNENNNHKKHRKDRKRSSY